MAVSGDILAAGATGTDLPGARNAGAAYIFERQGKEWKEIARLQPDPPQEGGGFGSAVAIDGKTVAVGARFEFNPGHGQGSGAVYIYTHVGVAWKLQARLAAEDGAPFDLFGDALALHGDWLAVGARAADGPKAERNCGAVYLYHRSGEAWTLQDRLAPATLAAEDHFGQALVMDESYLFASAPGLDVPGAANTGRVFGYRLQGQGWVEGAQLAAPDPQPEAQLGSVLGLEGSTLIALAGQEYQKGAMPPAAPMYGGDFGVLYIFELQNGTWSWRNRLAPVSKEQYGLQLRGAAITQGSDGLRLALSGMGPGGTYRYVKVNGGWQELPALQPGILPISPGNQITLSGNQVLLGHRLYDQNNAAFSNTDPLWAAGAIFVLDW